METFKSTTSILVAVALVGAVGFGAFWLFRGDKVPTGPANVSDALSGGSGSSTSTEPMLSEKLVVNDQFPAASVAVSSVSFDHGGWVVIRKNEKGAPGAILGEKYFEAGLAPGTVPLNQTTSEGGKYFAVLYSDDGDKKFDSIKDTPILKADGTMTMVTFTTTTNLPESKG